MSWQPQQDGVENIIKVLANLQTEDPAVHEQISKALVEFQKIPEYDRYLVYIFIHLENFLEVRMCAGLLLKNNIKRRPKQDQIDQAELSFLREEVVKGIADPNSDIRRTAGGVLTTIVGAWGIESWPGLIEFLVHCLDNQNPIILDGTFYAISLLCEDHPMLLEKENEGKPLQLLLPKFLSFYNHPVAEVRDYSISCILKVMIFFPNFMLINIEQFIKYFFCMAGDANIFIKKKTQTAFVNLISTPIGVNNCSPYLNQMVQYMVFCLNDREFMMVSCEFFEKLLGYENKFEEHVESFVPQMVPLLYSHLRYTQEDLEDKGNYDGDDAHIPDSNINYTFGMSNDDDDDGYDLYANIQSCRNSASEILDLLSRRSDESFLEILIPIIEKGFADSDWMNKEAAVLALGCIAYGQYRAMVHHLPGLTPFLFSLLRDQKPLVRSITCWVLSRYVFWIRQEPPQESNNGRTMFQFLVEELLIRVEDKNKDVQNAACFAIATISETAPEQIIPYVEAIFVQFHKAIRTFQKKNLFSLYDAIGSICSIMKSHFNNEKYMNLLLPPLIHRIENLADDDNEMFPLLDCFRSISLAVGLAFGTYALPLFKRCVKLIQASILGLTCHAHDPTTEPPEREFLVCSLDMTSALLDVLKEHFSPLIQQSNLIALLKELCTNFGGEDNVDFAQSYFAVIGDIARHCGNELIPILPVVIPSLLQGCNESRFVEMCNNALWAFGEVLLFLSPDRPYTDFPPSVHQFMPTFLNAALQLLHVQDDVDTEELFETAGVAVGRAAFVSPQQMVSTLDSIIGRFLVSLLHLTDGPEKEQALHGLCLVLFLKPDIVRLDFVRFCVVVGSWRGDNAKLIAMLGNLLKQFRASLGETVWMEYMNEIDETYYREAPDHQKFIRIRLEQYISVG
jgi:transportin-1